MLAPLLQEFLMFLLQGKFLHFHHNIQLLPPAVPATYISELPYCFQFQQYLELIMYTPASLESKNNLEQNLVHRIQR